MRLASPSMDATRAQHDGSTRYSRLDRLSPLQTGHRHRLIAVSSVVARPDIDLSLLSPRGSGPLQRAERPLRAPSGPPPLSRAGHTLGRRPTTAADQRPRAQAAEEKRGASRGRREEPAAVSANGKGPTAEPPDHPGRAPRPRGGLNCPAPDASSAAGGRPLPSVPRRGRPAETPTDEPGRPQSDAARRSAQHSPGPDGRGITLAL